MTLRNAASRTQRRLMVACPTCDGLAWPTPWERACRACQTVVRDLTGLDLSPEALYAPRLGDAELITGEV